MNVATESLTDRIAYVMRFTHPDGYTSTELAAILGAKDGTTTHAAVRSTLYQLRDAEMVSRDATNPRPCSFDGDRLRSPWFWIGGAS